MYASRIAADPPTVAMVEGFAPAIDVLAARNLAGHRFLRAAWYRGDGQRAGRTLVVRRGGCGDIIATIPTVAFGPAITGARKLPGSYWPLRAPLLAPDCSPVELAQALAEPAARGLGQVCRIGPTRRDDPAMAVLITAAQLAGWRVLSRPAGTSWVIDLDAVRANPPQRGSTPRKLRAGWRKLEALGTPRWWTVRGGEWSAAALVAMGQVEAESWIARTTDGQGAKFLTAAQRAVWQEALHDPVIADSLVAIILMLDDRPVAFSFDLDDGPVRYAIAGTHAEDLRHCQIGKITNYHSLDEVLAGDLRTLDLGAGDGGYKRDMGAVPGYDLVDLLFVRNRIAARVIAPLWGAALAPDAHAAPSLDHG